MVLFISTLVSSLAGFLFGYDNIVISGAIGYLSRYYHLSTAGIGWAAGCALIGCLAGSTSAGGFADKFGLRKGLYSCAICFALSSFGVWFAANFTQYVIWRIVGGLGIGAASIVAPMYIAEMAPARVRGRLVVFYQLGIVIGILAAVFANMLIERAGSDLWNLQHGWRYMFALGAAPAILFAIAISFSRESPRWLMKAGRVNDAERVLKVIHGTGEAAEESRAIRSSLSEEEGALSELFRGPFRKPLLIGFVLAALTQTSGITSILSFLPEVFRLAGQNSADAFRQAVLVGLVNVVFTIVAIWLVDRSGRRSLILTGTAIQTCSLALIGSLYFSGGHPFGILAGIIAFVSGHAIGNGAVCWVIIAEIFPNKVRGAAMSMATFALWMTAYLANQLFPAMQKAFGSHGLFFLFSGMAAINFVFVLLAVPETKGYSLEQISRLWTGTAKPALQADSNL
jgi:SP family arabinose:H+ symporter-like MFS transporter